VTKRKPPELRFDSWLERQIRDARERGLFDFAAPNADIRRLNRTASRGPPTTQALLDADGRATAWRAARATTSSS